VATICAAIRSASASAPRNFSACTTARAGPSNAIGAHARAIASPVIGQRGAHGAGRAQRGQRGPRSHGIAARHADIWNSLSFAKTFSEQLAETRERIAIVDDRCAAIGRDPTALRRSYLMFDPGARASGGRYSYYESTAAFEDMVGAVLALGISEIALYYPAQDSQAPMFERIAHDVIPRLRTGR